MLDQTGLRPARFFSTVIVDDDQCPFGLLHLVTETEEGRGIDFEAQTINVLSTRGKPTTSKIDVWDAYNGM